MDAVRAELKTCGATTSDISPIFTSVKTFARDGKPTSAGRYVLGLSDPDLRNAVQQDFWLPRPSNWHLPTNWEAPQPGDARVLTRICPGPDHRRCWNWSRQRQQIRRSQLDPAEGRKAVRARKLDEISQSTMDTWQRFLFVRELFELDPATYRETALEAARASLAGPAGQQQPQYDRRVDGRKVRQQRRSLTSSPISPSRKSTSISKKRSSPRRAISQVRESSRPAGCPQDD